jgi:DNA-binding XRE family transcriptional regulator
MAPDHNTKPHADLGETQAAPQSFAGGHGPSRSRPHGGLGCHAGLVFYKSILGVRCRPDDRLRNFMPREVAHPVDTHVGKRVRMRRLMLGLSQTKLGDALGLTFQQVQKYEKGTNRIGASRLQHISQILQVPAGFFFQEAPHEPGQSYAGDWVTRFDQAAW